MSDGHIFGDLEVDNTKRFECKGSHSGDLDVDGAKALKRRNFVDILTELNCAMVVDNFESGE